MGKALPLEGVRVIALEQAVAGPLSSRHLADLGAEVIKVERIDGGDFARDYDAFVHGQSSHFVWLNRGKKERRTGPEIGRRAQNPSAIAKGGRRVLSNLGPGAVDRIVSDDELVALNPELIRCIISGYGPDGPYEHRKAFDLLVQGEAGVTTSTGEIGRPAKPGVSLADLGAGIYATTAILAALRGRERSGSGDRIHIAMFDVMVEWMSPLLLAYREAGVEIEPAGTRHATITPYGPFETRDGKMLNIAVQNDRQWASLCNVLGLSSLAAQPDLATNKGRLAKREFVEKSVSDAIGLRNQADVASDLERAGIPLGSLNSVADVAHHPQLEGGRRWEKVVLPSNETVSVIASPFRVEGNSTMKRIPALGESTVSLLSELGYSTAETTQFLSDGVVGVGGAASVFPA
ncbi:CaiB/BaiF CoA transferase family protein [Arthrobacter sp. SD76]|uniref:CaiB/BaiF CoA transferase family protein n=1 Tax=Arthrobacter sp. SD76 TaxID=3415007 RepID=UPI003C7223A9